GGVCRPRRCIGRGVCRCERVAVTRVLVHAEVKRDLSRLRRHDKAAADAAKALMRELESSPRRGERLDKPGWRGYEVTPSVALIATGVGTGTIRVLGVGPLPTVYDPARLRAMAESAVASDMNQAKLEAGVPAPAARSRIVSLSEAEGTRS